MARAKDDQPWLELEALEAALARGGLARGYALRGEERYFRERALGALRRAAEQRGYEVCLHDAQQEKENADFQLARLIDDLSGGGLFAERRLVIVRNPGDHLKKAADEPGALTRAALAFVHSAGDAGTLVVSDTSLRADHALVKAILGAGGLAPAFRRLWENPPPWKPDPLLSELVLWTARRAAELGLRLSDEQALYVSAATGNDLFALDDQLETLRATGAADLRAAVRWTSGGSPWSVADHILAGDLARALAGIETLFRGGFQEKGGKRLLDASGLGVMLLGALQRGARSALELTRPGAAGKPSGSPVQQRAAQERARLRTAADWRALLDEAAALERALKNGRGVDASDFARLALRWSRSGAPRTVRKGAVRR